MRTPKIGTRILQAAIACLISTAGGLAAPITWSTPTAVATGPGNSADVSTNGYPVEAFNGQPDDKVANSPVVNGVTFVGTKTLITDTVVRNLGTSDLSANTNGGDASYDALLSQVDFGGGTLVTMTVGGNKLIPGQPYEIQIWFVDTRNARSMRYGDGQGTPNTVDLDDQFSIGSFTADGTNQTITIVPIGGSTQAHINAYQIRHITTHPLVTLSTVANPVAAPYTVNVTFTEDVTGLDASYFNVTNGTASGLLPASGPASNYTVTINPTAPGNVSVALPADSAFDTEPKGNLASNTVVTTYIPPGSEIPTVTLSTSASAPVFGPYTVDVTFSEDVTGLTASDFTVLNGSASAVTPPAGPVSNYTVTITPSAGGNVTVTLPANTVVDNDGDNLMNTASNSLVTAYTVPSIPTVTLRNPAGGSVVTGPYTIEVEFSENVTGLDASDFVVGNGGASSLSPASGPASLYTVVITPTIQGLVSVSLPSNSVTDNDGQGQVNTASNLLKANYIASGTYASALLDLSGRDGPGIGAGESNGFFPSPKTLNATTDFSLNDVAWSNGTESGTFDVSIVATGSKANILRGGRGAFGTANLVTEEALVAPNDSITLSSVVISDFKGDLAGKVVSGIKFIAVYLGNLSAGDGATINGQGATGAAGGITTAAMRNEIQPASSAVILGTGTGNGYSINGVALSFSVAAAPKVVSSAFNQSNEFVITFSGLELTRAYELRRSLDLISPFVPVPGTSKVPAAGTDSFTDSNPPAGKAFYQLWDAQP